METPFERAAAVKAIAAAEGFNLVGIAHATPSAYGGAYRAWIAAGKQGEMDYLARDLDERIELTQKFPWARTVICLGLAYYQNPAPDNAAPANDTAKIARYAWGRDYHRVMEGKLKRMERHVRDMLTRGGIAETERPEIRTYSDTGPILEREFAARAGLGWVGKNTLLIHPRQGSWFLLAEMILGVDLTPDDPIGDHCGTCRRCIEACPTAAITPYSVDARKCISYLTLEHRGEIAPEFHEPMRAAGYVAGCDICQEVCPFNRRPLVMSEPDFAARAPAPDLGLAEILAWQEHDWDVMTRGRAFRRAKFGMWKRNAAIVRGKL